MKRNGIEAIVDTDGILSLNEKNLKEGLDRKNLRDIATKHKNQIIET